MKFLITAAVVSLGGAACAQEMSYGEAEFLNSCAACHGVEARGDGALADELKTRPADLTRLSEKNGGEFPYQRVYAVIDGRHIVPGHGTRDMPVWGRIFLEGDTQDYGKDDGEFIASQRIHGLAEYIQTLQR